MKAVHVVPVDDILEHDSNDSCPCLPQLEVVTADENPVGWIYVHAAWDGRKR